MTLRYSFDSSALMGAWYRRLPPDVVPSFWRELDALIKSGDVGCIDEVKRELEKKTDELLVWIKDRPSLVVAISSEVFVAATEIVNQFPALTKPGTGRNAADPFVIALSQVTGAIVVTEEEPAKTPKQTKIPDVCRELKIECINVYGFVRAQAWKF